ncbi:GAMMA-TUBULIN COMPLEX COMPONENT 5 [Ceraceosorus bombacis]|uniref:GAMMA-TUBULIN COMPLEX COMPONENT 5 n=1 Tax=Ceraceosorus bombacis TaxID=401625 RepID=A0A0P1BMT3_9BASI|nr:GAMMA-TUBULIN COMPLEX COMPONENT 5 [Ceraceosorus bombacis]
MTSTRAASRTTTDELLARFSAAFASLDDDDDDISCEQHGKDDSAGPSRESRAAFVERYEAVHSIAQKHIRPSTSSRKLTPVAPATDYEAATEHIHGVALRNRIDLREEVSDALIACLGALDKSMSQAQHLARQSRALQESRRADRERRIANGQRAEDLPASLKGKQKLVEDPAITSRNAGEILALLLSLSCVPSENASEYAKDLLQGKTRRSYAYLDEEHQREAQREDEWSDHSAEGDADGSMSPPTATRAMKDAVKSRNGIAAAARADTESSDAHAQRLRAWQGEALHQIKLAGQDTSQRDHLSFVRRPFDLGQLDTLLALEVGENARIAQLQETHALREILLALQGNPNKLLRCRNNNGEYEVVADPARISHLSLGSWSAALTHFAVICTSLENLRQLSSQLQALSGGGIAGPSLVTAQSFRSFGGALDEVLGRTSHQFAAYDAAIAKALVRGPGEAPPMCTLTELTTKVDCTVATLLELEEIAREADLFQARISLELHAPTPFRSVTPLLDALLAAVRFEAAFAKGRDGKLREHAQPDPEQLAMCFVATASPLWDEARRWIVHGMPMASQPTGEDLSPTARVQRSQRLAATCSFFQRDHRLSPTDTTFWTEAWTLGALKQERGVELSEDASRSVPLPPVFLIGKGLAQEILSAGKAVGLLRLLGAAHELPLLASLLQEDSDLERLLVLDDVEAPNEDADADGISHDSENETDATRSVGETWSSMAQLSLGKSRLRGSHRSSVTFPESARVKPDEQINSTRPQVDAAAISRALFGDTISPLLRAEQEPVFSNVTDDCLSDALLPDRPLKLSGGVAGTQPQLAFVLGSEAGSRLEGGVIDLPAHISVLQKLFLWRSPDMSFWAHLIHPSMARTLPNAQVLEVSFREETRAEEWVDTGRVRFKSEALRSTGSVRALASISIDYEMPWPLTYMLTPGVIEAYQQMFTLQLQLFRASSCLSELLNLRPSMLTGLGVELQDAPGDGKLAAMPGHILHTRANDVRVSISLRVKMNWIVALLRRWIMTDILEPRCQEIAERLPTLSSFDEMIETHASSVRRMADLCFLSWPAKGSKVSHQASQSARLGNSVPIDQSRFDASHLTFDRTVDASRTAYAARYNEHVHGIILDLLDIAVEASDAVLKLAGMSKCKRHAPRARTTKAQKSSRSHARTRPGRPTSLSDEEEIEREIQGVEQEAEEREGKDERMFGHVGLDFGAHISRLEKSFDRLVLSLRSGVSRKISELANAPVPPRTQEGRIKERQRDLQDLQAFKAALDAWLD